MPDTVETNSSKIDFPTLCADITKYKDSGLINEEKYQAWQSFLSTFKEAYLKSPATYPEWPLTVLASKVSTHQDEEPPTVPDKILQLHNSEASSITPVSLIILSL